MQAGSRDPKETEGEELIDKFTTMEAATRPHVVPAVQLVDDKIQSGAISPVTKGETPGVDVIRRECLLLTKLDIGIFWGTY